MKRNLTIYLEKWKVRLNRKPLIIRGARQVGKTYMIEQFGKEAFDSVIKINFEESPELVAFFQTNHVDEILQNLETYFGKKIIPSKTLLFLDEIQICPEAIVTLRYFYENKPDLHLIAAGSLLDHTLNDLQYSMPVGRVEFAYLYPLSFQEFLLALNEPSLVEFIKKYTLEKNIPLPIHNKLMKLLRVYFFVGGMPEAVKNYAETKSMIDIERIHESISKSLEFDFSKYGTRTQQTIMAKLLHYLPRTIGQKFKYSNFDRSLRSETIKKTLHLLRMSRIIHLVYNTKSNDIPLEQGVVEKTFKSLFLDIGLSSHMLKLRLSDLENLTTNNEGALAEQFIGQELICLPPYFTDSSVYYWVRDKRNSEAEIDYLVQSGRQVIPIEVKAGKTGSLKSLHVFVSEKNWKKAIRFNTDVPSLVKVETSINIEKTIKKINFQLFSLPLYLASEYQRLIKIPN